GQMVCLWQGKRAITHRYGRFDPARAPKWFRIGVGRIERPGEGHGARAEAEFTNAIQRWVKDSTRLGIPVLFHEEALHGLEAEQATSFPQATALARTWNPVLVERHRLPETRGPLPLEIGRAHLSTPVTLESRMPPSAPKADSRPARQIAASAAASRAPGPCRTWSARPPLRSPSSPCLHDALPLAVPRGGAPRPRGGAGPEFPAGARARQHLAPGAGRARSPAGNSWPAPP